MWEACEALRDALLVLGPGIDGGKDSLSMAAKVCVCVCVCVLSVCTCVCTCASERVRECVSVYGVCAW